MQQHWYDYRLAFGDRLRELRAHDTVFLSEDQGVWRPDTFFQVCEKAQACRMHCCAQNEKRGWYHTIDSTNSYVSVRYDGLITYNTRLTLVLSCVMDLRIYPMDTQCCRVEFSSCEFRLFLICSFEHGLLLHCIHIVTVYARCITCT